MLTRGRARNLERAWQRSSLKGGFRRSIERPKVVLRRVDVEESALVFDEDLTDRGRVGAYDGPRSDAGVGAEEGLEQQGCKDDRVAMPPTSIDGADNSRPGLTPPSGEGTDRFGCHQGNVHRKDNRRFCLEIERGERSQAELKRGQLPLFRPAVHDQHRPGRSTVRQRFPARRDDPYDPPSAPVDQAFASPSEEALPAAVRPQPRLRLAHAVPPPCGEDNPHNHLYNLAHG